jgi:short-subunit dehydrogenase
MSHLLELATSYPNKPGLIVTSSALPFEPIPELFSLSLTKAAQLNLVRSMHMTYAPRGVHVGVINVGGAVSEDHERFNPANIAAKTWEWYADAQPEVNRFELVI